MKDNKCPNCGANLAYDKKSHRYACEYCKSAFIVKNEDPTSSDPRVELTPDDLKRVDEVFKNTSSHVSGAIVLVVIITIISFFLPIIAFISAVFSMF